MKAQSLRAEPMPAKKPLNQHKHPMSVSMEPDNREWVRQTYKDLGFRSESHLVDEAVRQLRDRAEKAKKTTRE